MKLKYRILGHLVYLLTSLSRRTLRLVVSIHPEYNAHQAHLVAFWHGKQLLPILELNSIVKTERAVLVSASRDGDILTTWLENLGYRIIRGSSRHQNISALSGMIRKLKDGHSLGFGIDGPIGPLHKVKPGMTHMSQKLQIPIIPVGSAFSRKWVIEKAWDKYEIPKLFSKAAIYVGKPFVVDAEADLDESNLRLEEAIHQAEEKAQSLLNLPQS
jgi:lysophospholipid acyltransferase (LPLAT)-like uncharacterized protein